jgi:hypothetical protein
MMHRRGAGGEESVTGTHTGTSQTLTYAKAVLKNFRTLSCQAKNTPQTLAPLHMEVRNVAHMGDGTGIYRVLVGRHEERDHLKDLGVDGKIILKWIFKNWDGGHELD